MRGSPSGRGWGMASGLLSRPVSLDLELLEGCLIALRNLAPGWEWPLGPTFGRLSGAISIDLGVWEANIEGMWLI